MRVAIRVGIVFALYPSFPPYFDRRGWLFWDCFVFSCRSLFLIVLVLSFLACDFLG